MKQKIGLPTPDSNPQIMFEQIASVQDTNVKQKKIAARISGHFDIRNEQGTQEHHSKTY